jgi:hypothetical protein
MEWSVKYDTLIFEASNTLEYSQLVSISGEHWQITSCRFAVICSCYVIRSQLSFSLDALPQLDYQFMLTSKKLKSRWHNQFDTDTDKFLAIPKEKSPDIYRY